MRIENRNSTTKRGYIIDIVDTLLARPRLAYLTKYGVMNLRGVLTDLAVIWPADDNPRDFKLCMFKVFVSGKIIHIPCILVDQVEEEKTQTKKK